VGKFWSLVFLLVPVFGVGVFIYGASPSVNIWLPPDVSESGHNIDHLFMFILWLTGIVFVATEGALFWFLWKYNAQSNPKPAKYTHGSHNLEIVWTILPSVTLLFIAIYQMNAWADSKIRNPSATLPNGERDPNVVEIEVQARQFEWRLRYPGKDGKLGTPDDLFTVNDIHVPVGKMVLVQLKSQDVLHSFFLPNLRVKQDAVPGMRIPVWFRPIQIGRYDLPCAELCGWGHYKMKGQLTVESEEDYQKWLDQLSIEQNATTPPAAVAKAEGKSE
jgi:cytochrome c oxidase subunit II